jgi:hypothetical protein
VPPPQAEKLFLTSFNDTFAEYRKLLAETRQNQLHLVNENFDTGRPTRFGQYRMADAAYDKLLEKLAGESDKIAAEKIDQGLRDDILAFYQGSPGPMSEKSRAMLAALQNQTTPAAIAPPLSPSRPSVP